MSEASQSASSWREDRVARWAYPLAAGALALAGVRRLDNPDTFGHLAQGREIAELGHVPTVDSRSFWLPEPAPWRNYEWLSDAWSWQLFTLGGADALLAWNVILLALAGALFVERARLTGGARAALLCALFLLLAIPGARFRFVARPHLVALPLAALYLVGLARLLAPDRGERRKTASRWIAVLTLAHVLWVNLHGSHLLGLAFTSIHLVATLRAPIARARLATLLALQLGASCVSPFGPAIAFDAIEHLWNPAYRALVPEWGSFQPDQPPWIVGAFLVETALLAGAVRSLHRGGAAERALLGCTLLLALAAARSLRFTAEYLLVSAPALAIAAASMISAIAWPRLRLALGTTALAAAGTLTVLAAQPTTWRWIGRGIATAELPAASAQWLATHARAPRVLAHVDDAWYLAFAVPEARFFIDGRLPFFGVEHIRRLQWAFADPAYLARVLAEYRVDAVVVRHSFQFDVAAREAMRVRPDWMLATVENAYALFVRHDLAVRGSRPAPLRLHPGYEPAWLYHASVDEERAILQDLARLPDHENARGYRTWVRAVLAAKPLARAGAHDGLRAPESTAEHAALAQALHGLRHTAEATPRVPIVHAQHALVAALACKLDEAERALARAGAEGTSRETLLVPQEIALRRGRLKEVEAFLRSAEALPAAAGDPWLGALRAALASPPRCP